MSRVLSNQGSRRVRDAVRYSEAGRRDFGGANWPTVHSGGGGGTAFVALITGCPDGDNIGKAKMKGDEDAEEVDVYIRPGLWASLIGRECLVVEVTNPDFQYAAVDLLPLKPGKKLTGSYSQSSPTTYASVQIDSPAEACEEE